MSDWAGRRLHFIGIGGAGMSGLALVCARLGARVSGSDRADSSYLERLRRAGSTPVSATTPPTCPRRRRSSSRPRSARTTRSSRRPRARPHGPAPRRAAGRALRREAPDRGRRHPRQDDDDGDGGLGAAGARRRPGLLRRRRAARAGRGGGGARTPAGARASGSSPRPTRATPASSSCSREIAVVTNVEMDHHSRWGSVAELRAAFDRLRRRRPRSPSSTRPRPGPAELRLAVPGRHNLLNARAALAAVELAGVDVERGGGGARRLPRRAAAARAEGRARRGRRLRRLRPPSDRGARRARGAARARRARLIAVFQPHLYSRTKAFAEEFGAALALADEAVVLDVYPAREEPVGELAGVSGLLVAGAAADRMGGRPVCWAPTRSGRSELLERRLGAGRVLVTIGAGDVFTLGEARCAGEDGGGRHERAPAGRRARLPAGAADDGAHRRARPTGSPGPRPRSGWSSCSPGPSGEGLAVGVVGSGSNLLVADEGFRGLAIKLDGELAAIEREGERAALRRRRAAALGGGEGGGLGPLRPRVRDQHPRHRGRRGEDERQRLRRPARRGARVGRRLHRGGPRAPRARGARLRLPQLQPRRRRRSSPAPPSGSRPRTRTRSRRRWRGCASSAARRSPPGSRPSARPSRTPRTAAAEGRTAGQLLEAAGCRGLRVGGARFSEKHANFVENDGRRDAPPTCSS